jgi:ribosomal protein S18 acetylase RimI-like enzyme
VPTSTILVRSARPDEHAAVGDLTVAGYDADGYLRLSDGRYDHGYAAWLRAAADRARGSTLLVAVEADQLLGTVTWCPPGSPDRQTSAHDHQGEFRTLSVAPTARRRGVAQALVTDCLRRARETGLTEMTLCSLPEMTPAHRLYASFGFVRRPDLDFEPEPGLILWGFAAPVA